MYVWVDALANYLTGAGYPDNPVRWPADLHVIGKDIVRFHAVYWPAFLMAAGLELPHQVFAHGFLLNRGEKMSKSIGNVVDPLDLARAFGVDALRYFLLREVPFGQDGSYSAEAIVTRTNAELANSFGNLAQRVLSMIAKNLDGELPAAGEDGDDRALIERVSSACATDVAQAFSDLAFSQGIESWMQAVFACNQYVDAQAPWALRKTDPERMKAVLGTLFCCLRDLTIAITPVIPGSATKLLDALGIDPAARDHAALADAGWYERLRKTGFRLAPPTAIFPRLDPVEAE
jgi:methionyl-tRNA synthetase